MSKILAGLALATLAGAASAQTITFSVVFNPAGPVGNGALVSGTVHVLWNGGTTGATGLAGGQFRIRFGDTGNNFTTAGITAPLGSNGAALELTGDRVGVPAAGLPPVRPAPFPIVGPSAGVPAAPTSTATAIRPRAAASASRAWAPAPPTSPTRPRTRAAWCT